MEYPLSRQVDDLYRYLVSQSVSDSLARIADPLPRKTSFSASFGLEEQVLPHFIFTHLIAWLRPAGRCC